MIVQPVLAQTAPEVFTPQPPWETLPPPVALMMFVAMVVAGVVIFAPLMKALARRIEGGGDRQLRGEIDELRARLDAVEQGALTSGEFESSFSRVDDLQERVEFVERLLARNGRESSS